MQNKEYIFNIKGLENPIIIKPSEVNKQTSLNLHGSDTFNYGEDLLTNTLRLAEHFSSEKSPDNPILGQLWYNSSTKILNVYKSSGWFEIVNKPNDDYLSIIYKEELPEHSHGKLVLKNILPNYIPYTGNHKNVEIKTSKTIFEEPLEAVTKKYVDDSLTEGFIKYLRKDAYSETMTGPFKVMDVSENDNDYIIANVGYIKDLGWLDTISTKTLGNMCSICTPDKSCYTGETFKTTNYNIHDRKINGVESFDDIFTTVFFTIRINSGNSYTIKLPFSYGFKDTRWMMTTIANSINRNVRLSINIENGSTITITKLNHNEPLAIHGTIFGFRDNPAKLVKPLE